jgi:hypothetical protein
MGTASNARVATRWEGGIVIVASSTFAFRMTPAANLAAVYA